MKTSIKIFIVSSLIIIFAAGTISFAGEVEDYDQYLIDALKNENIGVRASAAQLLGDRKVQAAVKPLMKMLKSEESYACRIVAARALYKIGDESALPLMKKIAKYDRNKTVRRVVTALIMEMENVSYAGK